MAGSNVFGRSENVALNAQTFKEFAGTRQEREMTVQGAVARTGILLAIVVASAASSWAVLVASGGAAVLWLIPAALTAFVLGLITCRNKQAAPVTAPIYAFLEGGVLGVISAFYETDYPGIVPNAILLTFGTLSGLLVVYKASGFQVTARFRAGILAATLGVVVVYFIDLALQLLGIPGIAFIHSTGIIGIGTSLVIVVIAALNLVLDFDLIEQGAAQGAPRYMEWYAAFGLMVTLIWLYLEVLRLLAMLASSSDDH